MESDWKEILNLSQKELKQLDKDKLCENLAWMEADDIELNFTDLKILFRMAQDILKYKTEQVNGLLGQLQVTQQKTPSKGLDHEITEFEAEISNQEEVIKINKELIDQLHADIAELEGRRTKLEENLVKSSASDSSHNTISEINTIAQLENEILKKNRHIRKLLGDITALDEENSKLKSKLAIFKDKLKESTLLIENMTQELQKINNENSHFKEILGKTEREKNTLATMIDDLKKEFIENDFKGTKIEENFKAKQQQLKNLLKMYKEEIEKLRKENVLLKNSALHSTGSKSLPNGTNPEQEIKIKELQEKLVEASEQMLRTANLIQSLKIENNELKQLIETGSEHTISDHNNESDDGKEKLMITKLNKKIKKLAFALKSAEEIICSREQEIAGISSQLQLLQSSDGTNILLDDIKNKKHQIKTNDEAIKSLVNEINNLNQVINDLQLENETMREKLDIPRTDKIETCGVLRKYKSIEKQNESLLKKLQKLEKKQILSDIDIRSKNLIISRLSKVALNSGGAEKEIHEILNNENREEHTNEDISSNPDNFLAPPLVNIQDIIEENEGLRNSLTEILNALKDNSTSSGILSVECPSLENILQSMDARRLAGWYSPHMKTIMELRTLIGSKDALLIALRESRKDILNITNKLRDETNKSTELKNQLSEMKPKVATKDEASNTANGVDSNMFQAWILDNDYTNVDFTNNEHIFNILIQGDSLFKNQVKQALLHFQNKFTDLYDKLTFLTIQSVDNKNSWSIQEEYYKAEIENLKQQISENDDEISNLSPGLLSSPKSACLENKCIYLENAYKHIRTLNENIKNEYLEEKKQRMIMESEYEIKINNLNQMLVNLTEKLRNTIPINLFWKQNHFLNDVNIKYRNIIESNAKNVIETNDLMKRLDQDKSDIINGLHMKNVGQSGTKINDNNSLINVIEQSIIQEQLKSVCTELENKTKHVQDLEKKLLELQQTQAEIMNKCLYNYDDKDKFWLSQINQLKEENFNLNNLYQQTFTKLNVALLQLQAKEQSDLQNDVELNMLRHHILDLQSSGNKAVIARLSGEILLYQLQASENVQKIDMLKMDLNKEKQLRAETEKLLINRQKFFERSYYEFANKVRNLYEMIDILRQQYQGSLPLCSLENFINNVEDLNRKNNDVSEKLSEIDDLRNNLIIKHNIYEQIQDLYKSKCFDIEENCTHRLKYIVTEKMQESELNYYKQKILNIEQARKVLSERCISLEKLLIMSNNTQVSPDDTIVRNDILINEDIKDENIKLEDIVSDDESSHKSQTFTIQKPNAVPRSNLSQNDISNSEFFTYEAKDKNTKLNFVNNYTQTYRSELKSSIKQTQTSNDEIYADLKKELNKITSDKLETERLLNIRETLVEKQSYDIDSLKQRNVELDITIKNLIVTNNQLDKMNQTLQNNIENLKTEIHELKNSQSSQINRTNAELSTKNQILMQSIQKIENDKNRVLSEYKELLDNERKQFLEKIKSMQLKLKDLQAALDERGRSEYTGGTDFVKEASNKLNLKISDLEHKCFTLEKDLDVSKTDLTEVQDELERWKNLAAERLTKMEQLSTQLKERHNQEMESYKAENQHWLTQLNETQQEYMDLRSRITEQRTLHLKQLAEKDSQIEQFRYVINNLKTQILNLQSMLSIHDPNFDLSAIVEVDEASDMISQQGSDKLELKFESTVDLNETHDDFLKIPSSSTAIWQEPVLDRLRKEKQLLSKQNTMLRRQIKAISARERRAKLDAQNLKNQVFRITTNGSKVPSAESAAMQQKILTLQSQLTSARRETQSTVALWDKWKRAQQSSDRWQMRYEEKFQEVKKLETSLQLAKSSISRLEKEKRLLLTRLNEYKQQNQIITEKQDAEKTEKSTFHSEQDYTPPPVSSRALLDRIEAQQRRIVALEVAEKGKEPLVSEYEKAMAEITSLKGQVIKLESTLLESQIRIPMKSTQDIQPELDYWKNYCDMLKEENMQLTLKLNSAEHVPTSAHQQRVNDLEQTVLTLRGLVSKLQAEQKSSTLSVTRRRADSLGRDINDKVRNQIESYRTEIANLKRTIQEKDLLLERSKEMLKIAAEREEQLLRENTILNRRLQFNTDNKDGFLSA